MNIPKPFNSQQLVLNDGRPSIAQTTEAYISEPGTRHFHDDTRGGLYGFGGAGDCEGDMGASEN